MSAELQEVRDAILNGDQPYTPPQLVSSTSVIYARDKGILPTNTGDQNARALKAFYDDITTEESVLLQFEPETYQMAGSYEDAGTEIFVQRIFPKTLKKLTIDAKGANFNQVASDLPVNGDKPRVLFDLIAKFDDMKRVAYNTANDKPLINTTVLAGTSLNSFNASGELATTTAITMPAGFQSVEPLAVNDVIRVCPLNVIRQAAIGSTPGVTGNAYNGALARITAIYGRTIILDKKLYDQDEFITDVHIAKYNPCAFEITGFPQFKPDPTFDNSQTGQGDGTDGYVRFVGSLHWRVELDMENAPANGFAHFGCAFGDAKIKARNFPDRPADQGSAYRVGYPAVSYQGCHNSYEIWLYNSRHPHTTNTGSFVGQLNTKGGLMPASVKNQGNIIGAAGFGRTCYETVKVHNMGGVEASIDVHDEAHHIYFVDSMLTADAIRDNTSYNTTTRVGQFRGEHCAAFNCHFGAGVWFETTAGRFDVTTKANNNTLFGCFFHDVGGRAPIVIKDAQDTYIKHTYIENSETNWQGSIIVAEGNDSNVYLEKNTYKSKSYKNAPFFAFRDNTTFEDVGSVYDVSHRVIKDDAGTLRTINANKDIYEHNNPTAKALCISKDCVIKSGLNSFGEIVTNKTSNDFFRINIQNMKEYTDAATNATHAVYEDVFVDYTSYSISFEDDGGTYYIRDAQLGLITQGLAVGSTFTITGTTNNNATFTVATIAADELTVNEAVTTEDATGDAVRFQTVAQAGKRKTRFIGINRFGSDPAIRGGNAKDEHITIDGYTQYNQDGEKAFGSGVPLTITASKTLGLIDHTRLIIANFATPQNITINKNMFKGDDKITIESNNLDNVSIVAGTGWSPAFATITFSGATAGDAVDLQFRGKNAFNRFIRQSEGVTTG